MQSNQQSSSVKRCGTQRHRCHYHIPEEIAHLGDMPLFRAVAWWGYLRKKAFSRNEVSEAFQIDLRRASGILHYICHRHDKNDIVFRVRKTAVQGGHCQLWVKILAPVASHAAVKPAANAAAREHRRSKNNATHDRQLSQWLLSRPAGNNEAELAAWKAACPLRE